MTWGVFVVATLAAYRVSRLITTDDITEPLRVAIIRRWPATVEAITNPNDGSPMPGSAISKPQWPVVLVHCTWCVSLWISLAVVLIAHATGFDNSWTLVAFDWLASATVCGFLARLEA
jgi:hypothetical protein